MQNKLRELTDAGIRLAVISVDEPEASREHRQRAGYTFTFLADPQMEVIRRYDVAVEDEGIARPAEFLVDAGGTVRWRSLTDGYYSRVRPEEVLEAARLLP
jgi:peroxiredoxin